MTPLRLGSVVDITPASSSSTTTTTTTPRGATASVLPRLLIPRSSFRGNNGEDEDAMDVCIEAVVQRRREDGRYHLVLRSGPDQVPPEIHATYLLPADTHFPSTRAASASPKMAYQDPYLAVLTHPHSLVLHEVHPSNGKDGGSSSSSSLWTAGEGWTVALPMETDGVWAHPQGAGWILQRRGTVGRRQQQQQQPAADVEDPMRWFTLEQVWEDPRPVRLRMGDNTTTAGYDWEQERLVWVQPSQQRNQNDNKRPQRALTYHPTERRHTLWIMEEELAQPLTRPLYEQTRMGHATLSDVSLLWGGLDDPHHHPHDNVNDASTSRWTTGRGDGTPTLTRQEALAQALRVGSTSHKKAATHRRSRPSAAAAAFATETAESRQHATTMMESSISSLIYPKWSWKPVAQQVARQAAKEVWILSGDDPEASVLALLVPQHQPQDENVVYEIQHWPLTSTDDTTASHNRPTLTCRGAQPVQVVAGRTDLLVWTMDGQLVLYRSGHEALLPYATPPDCGSSPITALADAWGARVSVACGRRLVRASVALQYTGPAWVERLFQMLETETPLVWALRLDCVRLHDLLLAQNPDTPKIAALEVVVEVLMELDWQKGQLTPPAASAPQQEEDSWDVLLASDFHHEFSTAFEDLLYLGEEAPRSRPKTCSWMRRVYLENHPLLVRAWKSDLHEGSLAIVFDSMHLLWQDTLLFVQQRPLELLELLVKIVRTVSLVNPSNDVAPEFADEYLTCGGPMPAVDPLQLDPVKAMHTKFTEFEEEDCPSIFEWIDCQLRNEEGDEYYDNVEDIHPVLARSRSICRLFQVLTGPGGIPATDSRVVEALVEEGIDDAATLREDLPTGLALPLLDVLYRCRNNEEASLSAKGWALVGREDVSRNLTNDKITAPEPPRPEKVATGPIDQANHEGGGLEEEADAEFGDLDDDGLVPLELRSSMLFPKDNRVHEAARLVRSSRPIFLRVPRSVEVSDHEFEQLKQKKLSLLVQRALALSTGRGMMTIGGVKPVAAEPLPIPELCLKGRVPPANATLSLDQSECTPESRIWPEFHNGVAAGLRLPLPDECSETMSRVTRSWIVYNRPAPTVQENGDPANRTGDLKSHSHGGFLLALGLRGHLTALEMTDLYEYLTEGTVTTTVGVLLGMAANKRGTCDMAISTMLFLHVPSLIPQHFSAIDVASAVQTAAVTGAGLLFQGSSHRMMTEFLLNEIGKRPESDMSAFDREAYTLACGIALGMVNLCVGNSEKASGLEDLEIEARLRRFIEGGEANEDEHRRVRETNDRFSIPMTTNGSDSEKCSIVHEGNLINTDLTSPAATLALGLMYMKTGNQTVASAVDLPDTHFLLEWVRPDFLGLRVLAKALILWDDVIPTKEWVDAQIPVVVKEAYNSMRNIAKKASEGISVRPVYDFDRRSVRQMYVHVLAGACFAVGVRFAGTGDARAKTVLCDYVMELHQLREANDPVSIVSKPEFAILETCLAQASTALALVMAGTGDLDALRIFKILRWRHDKDIKFGSHMAYGMAIGLLFLGGGTMTLGREPEHIAAIVTAFFPRYPAQSGDNQYHLQALRHLYALAAQRRELCAVDVDSGTSVHVTIELKSPGSDEAEVVEVPCLRRNADSPKNIVRVTSGDFYPVSVDLQTLNGSAFFVKKRSSIGRDVLARYSDTPWSKQIEGSTTSPFFLMFAEYMDKAQLSDPFLRNHFLDAVADDAEESVIVLFSLARELVGKGGPLLTHSLTWDLRFIMTYFKIYDPEKTLIGRESFGFVLERLEEKLAKSGQVMEGTEFFLRASVLYKDADSEGEGEPLEDFSLQEDEFDMADY